MSMARDKTLALAALFQSAGLASELARRGQADAGAEAFLMDTALVMDTDDTGLIYPDGGRQLTPGLTWLEGCLLEQGRGLERAGEIIRLALAIIQVEHHLERHADVQARLRQRLFGIIQQRELRPDLSQGELASLLGAAYVDNLGGLGYRVQIRGDARQLQSPGMAERIRAVLLAGVRAVWLWRRLGGRRWHLMFQRGEILREIRAIAKSV